MAYNITYSIVGSDTHMDILSHENWECSSEIYLNEKFDVCIYDNEIVISLNNKMPMVFIFEEAQNGQFAEISTKPCLKFYSELCDALIAAASVNSTVDGYIMNNEE